MEPTNIDPSEVAKFEPLADRWWDTRGEMKSLHDINGLRLGYIKRGLHLKESRVLDAGCGGGILSEAMAKQGARVTGIDASATAVEAAHRHARASDVPVDYARSTVEIFAQKHPARFDAVTCMELIEHVPQPESLVRACARLIRPGGSLFVATLNRNLKSYLFAIFGAERVLRLLPKGTHQWKRFVKPGELDRWAVSAGLERRDWTGLHYNPLTRRYSLGGNLHVNYMAHYVRTRC